MVGFWTRARQPCVRDARFSRSVVGHKPLMYRLWAVGNLVSAAIRLKPGCFNSIRIANRNSRTMYPLFSSGVPQIPVRALLREKTLVGPLLFRHPTGLDDGTALRLVKKHQIPFLSGSQCPDGSSLRICRARFVPTHRCKSLANSTRVLRSLSLQCFEEPPRC